MVKGNVLKESEFRQLISDTLDYVADSIGQTFGPHGHNALVQSGDNVYSTKDGWNVLQSIHFDDPTIMVIKTIIESVGQSTVLTVGDGSTTSTIAARNLNYKMDELTSKYTIREIEDTLKSCTNTIINNMKDSAIEINDSNMSEIIHKVAMVSTNWDEELSQLITDIYKETKNPIIKVEESGTDSTYVEYIDGYDLAGSLLLKEWVVNDYEHIRYVTENPVILVFNYNLQSNYFPSLSYLGQILRMVNRPLVILAPDFENSLVSQLAALNDMSRKAKQPIINMTLAKITNYYNIDRDCIRDFCVLAGAVPISITDDDFKEFMDDLTKTMSKTSNGLTEEEANILNEAKASLKDAAIEYANSIGGTCETIIIDEKHVLAKGLPNIDSEEAKNISEIVKTDIDNKIKNCTAKTIMTDDIRMKRVRLGKLAGKMGTIKIGGYGTGNLKAKKDALDDAIRACEAAYTNGVHTGGCISIISQVSDYLTDEKKLNTLSDIEKDIYQALLFAFTNVWRLLFINKYGKLPDTVPVDGKQVDLDTIMATCIEKGYAFNTITNKYDETHDIINPVNVDVEVLKACLRLVIICATSNQFICKKYIDLDNVGGIQLKEIP